MKTAMTTTRGFGWFAAATLALLLAAPVAHAGNVDAKERAARKACLSGDYAKGVEILSDLFIDTKDANFIFNQARCFEQNSRYEEAISRFREYLRKATKLGPDERADAEKHIADCQALITPKGTTAGESAAVPAPKAEPVAAPAPVPVVLAAPPSPPPVATPESVATTSATTPETSNGRGLRVGGIVAGAVGLASIGTGIYFYTQAKHYSDLYNANPNASDESSGKSAQTMQWVFYSVGGAAIATGAVLYILGSRSVDSGAPVAGIAPMVGPGLAGISAHGAF